LSVKSRNRFSAERKIYRCLASSTADINLNPKTIRQDLAPVKNDIFRQCTLSGNAFNGTLFLAQVSGFAHQLNFLQLDARAFWIFFVKFVGRQSGKRCDRCGKDSVGTWSPSPDLS
jgi:hypothetical protein